MSKLKDKGLDLSEGRIVKIAMKCGRLPIQSADHDIIGRHRVKVPGVVLHMKDIENGGTGYAELDLDNPEDAQVYKVFSEWYEEGRDPRIRTHGVKPIPPDSVPAPMPWWDNSSAQDLLKQVKSGIANMADSGQREAYLIRCVKYESQRDNPRKTLINSLLDIEIDGASVNDPLAVPLED